MATRHDGYEGLGMDEGRSTLDRRSLLKTGGVAIAAAAVGFGANRFFSENKDHGVVGGSSNQNLDNSEAIVENQDRDDPHDAVEPTTTPEMNIIRVEDLPRDESLYAGLISPEEVIDALENGTEKDIRDMFEVPVEKVLVNGELNAELACRKVFEKIELGLYVGFDAKSIGPFLNLPDGKQLFIQAATAHDARIASVISGYPNLDLASGKSGNRFLTRYFTGGHEKALSRFYDSATATNAGLRSLNETIRINTKKTQQWPMSGVDYSVLTTFEITNVMNIENPPLTPIDDAKGDMILWAEVLNDSSVRYNLSPKSVREEITPFDKIY